jgi:hypothetical protein
MRTESVGPTLCLRTEYSSKAFRLTSAKSETCDPDVVQRRLSLWMHCERSPLGLWQLLDS